MINVSPYSVLALLYDDVMDYVDFEAWADYVDHVLDEHGKEPRTAAELACGTGQFAWHLLARRRLEYTATDGSATMLACAARRLEGRVRDLREVRFPGGSFLNDMQDGAPYDVIFLLFDGVNYLLDEEDVLQMLAEVKALLSPGGVFIFDQSTPTNSINNKYFFEDEGTSEAGSWLRQSTYDEKDAIHTTRFELTVPEGSFEEVHVERAWTMGEMQRMLRATGFDVVAAYDGFSLDHADDRAERIHWVVEAASHD
ncbi:MAG: methyltransferase type 11 [Bacteroidetes bacterium CG12_big_fil_rev_8_21_14_0_65_60_17]|nr:MAG: methyltransferase type 11 [Bacteroidetes bacterium CG12_big_fil_rev_8_21_14_0_65_60_17]